MPPSPLSKRDYVARALRGGYTEAVRRDPGSAWYTCWSDFFPPCPRVDRPRGTGSACAGVSPARAVTLCRLCLSSATLAGWTT